MPSPPRIWDSTIGNFLLIMHGYNNKFFRDDLNSNEKSDSHRSSRARSTSREHRQHHSSSTASRKASSPKASPKTHQSSPSARSMSKDSHKNGSATIESGASAGTES